MRFALCCAVCAAAAAAAAPPMLGAHTSTAKEWSTLRVSGSVGCIEHATLYMLSGVDPACADGPGSALSSCAICVHEAPSCASAHEAPHITHAHYTSDRSGSASGVHHHDNMDTDMDHHVGHALVVHAHDGSPLACAMLRHSTAEESAHWVAMAGPPPRPSTAAAVHLAMHSGSSAMHSAAVLLQTGGEPGQRDGTSGVPTIDLGGVLVFGGMLMAIAAAIAHYRRGKQVSQVMNEAAPLKQSQAAEAMRGGAGIGGEACGAGR